MTNYRATRGISFDGYHGQDVLVFEEFSSQIPIEDMLNYLDIYPLSLPARTMTKRPVTQKYISHLTRRWKINIGGTAGEAGNLAGIFSAIRISIWSTSGRLHDHPQERGLSL